ncbi:MAG: hypothetical protein J6W00_05000 [Lentisphaeria bacterium]|nr:hypothetical protein [Lentisphaeria bacterium]
MKELLRKIIAIFFLTAALLTGFELHSAVPVASGLILHDDISGDDLQFLRKLIRQLDRYARRADIKHNSDTFTIFCGKDDLCGYVGKKKIFLPGNASLWRYDFQLRRKIIGVIASHRFNYNYSQDSSGVAEWIVNGIDSELEAADKSGQYIVANRRYLFWSEAAGYTAALPDFAAMARVGKAKNRGMNRILGEHARMLLNILARDKKIGTVFEASCRNEEPDGFMRHYGSNRKAAQEKFNSAALQLIWNQYSPMPGELILNSLQDMEKHFIPELDKNFQPTGNYISCSWKELAYHLSKKRPDSAQLRRNAISGFSRLSKMLAAEEKKVCSSIIGSIDKFGIAPDAYENFAKQENELKKLIQKRIKRDIFLKKTLEKHGSLPDRFQTVFEMLDFNNPACSPEEINFLNHTLNNYLQ